jgi:hypothetical protein
MASQFSGLGVQKTFWGFNDDAGYLTGTATELANGEDSGMGILKGVGNINLQLPADRVIDVPGDNTIVASFLIPAATSPQGEMVARVYNPEFVTLSESALINTEDGLDFALMGIPCPTYRSLTLISNAPAKAQTSGSVGQPVWRVNMYFNLNVQALGNNIQDATPDDYTHTLVANRSDVTPWGAPITSVLYGATQAYGFRPFQSPYPIHMQAFVGDNSIDTLVLDETPAAASSVAVRVYEDGVKQVYTTDYTVVTATKTISFVAAPAAGAKVEVFYQFIPSC